MRVCRGLPVTGADTDLYRDTEDRYIEFEGEQGHGHHRNHHYHRRYDHFI